MENPTNSVPAVRHDRWHAASALENVVGLCARILSELSALEDSDVLREARSSAFTNLCWFLQSLSYLASLSDERYETEGKFWRYRTELLGAAEATLMSWVERLDSTERTPMTDFASALHGMLNLSEDLLK